MRKNTHNTTKKTPTISSKRVVVATDNTLHHLAFDNSLQGNIITITSNGRIISANNAACKLLGYSKKELLTQSRATIYNVNESSFKKMLKQRTAEGRAMALVTAIKKDGKFFSCEVTSAVFMDEDGIEKAIYTIANVSQSILKQKRIDTEKEKIVAGNITLAKAKQKEIDSQKEKIVADNIALVKLEQKKIDTEKEKVVEDNIVLAKAKQKEIDSQKEKIVADDIALVKLEQKKIDTEKEKIVAGNIALVKTRQKEIDGLKEKIVADDIALVKLEQKKIDTEKEKIVAGNIVLAKANQKKIDARKDKIVADDIALAKSVQKKMEIRNEELVAHNIILAQAKTDAMAAENIEWKKYAGKNSYDVMWDWNVITGEIYVGDSIEEVFGYKVQNNTVSFSDFTWCLLPEEKEAIEKKISETLTSGSKRWNDSFMLKRSDGSLASTNSRASIMRDEEGKAILLIGAIKDVSRLKELKKKLEEQNSEKKEENEIFQLAAKLSFDGIWDWNILTNEFFLGDGFEELFGHTFSHTGNETFDWSKHLHPADKEAVEKGLLEAIGSTAVRWEHAYRFIRADGSVAEVFGRASIIRNADGKACRMIGVVHDLSRQRELEEKLEAEIATKGKLFTEYKENFKLIFNSSSDVLFDSDLITGEVIFSDAYEKEFGYKITGNMIPADDWISHIHPDDKEALMQDYSRMLASEDTEWKYSYRFLRADNSVANVVSSRVILRNAEGKACRMIGSIQDISKQKVLEEKLAREIKLKEKQIAEAAEEAKNAERSDIGRELHDNVNQLLAVSRLYVGMAKQGGENSKMYLNRSAEYTLNAIEEIRKLTKELTTDTIKNLGLCEAIEKMAGDIMEVNPVKISCTLKGFSEDSVNDKLKHTLFRVAQEQLNNILKHAKATQVSVNLSQNKKSIRLVISDNGIGFDTGKKRSGIGIDNIRNRAASYSGTADFASQPGQGCVLTITIPMTTVPVPHQDMSIK